jgi:hypothetical protein
MCTAIYGRAMGGLFPPVSEIPDFVSVFNHLSDTASFSGCFAEPETAPAITGQSPILMSGNLPRFDDGELKAEKKRHPDHAKAYKSSAA